MDKQPIISHRSLLHGAGWGTSFVLTIAMVFLTGCTKTQPPEPPPLIQPVQGSTPVKEIERPNSLSILEGALGVLNDNLREEQLQDVTTLANLLTAGQADLPSADQHASSTQYVQALARDGKWPAGIDLPVNPADNPWVLSLDVDLAKAIDGDPLLLAIPHPSGKNLAEVVGNGPEEIVVACLNRAPEIVARDVFLARLTPEQKKRPVLVP